MTLVFDPPGNDIVPDDVVFELPSDNARVEHVTRTGFILNGAGSTVKDVLSDLFGEFTDADIDGEGARAGVYLDLGGGQHVLRVESELHGPGAEYQWGDGSNTRWDATGEDVETQMQLFDRVMQLVEIDSRPGHAAYLSFREYSEDGDWAPLRVIIEQPEEIVDYQRESSTGTFSATFIEAYPVDRAVDALKRGIE